MFLFRLLYISAIVFGSCQIFLPLYGKMAQENDLATASSFDSKIMEVKSNRLLKIGKIVFVGDMMLARDVENKIKEKGDYNYPFILIKDFISSADIAFANLEGPISNGGKKSGSIYSFRASPLTADGIKNAGFDVLSLANNHIWDYGKEALDDTLSILEQKEISFAGAGKNYEEANKPVLKKIGNTKIAFLAFTNLYPENLVAGADSPGISDFDEEKIQQEIKKIKGEKLADIVAVSLHWGEEYQTNPAVWQKVLARILIDNGADLIIGHHPHVAQMVEKYQNGWIAYSLGNFVFDQSFSPETMAGLTLEVSVRNGKIKEAKTKKIIISPDYQPYLETP